MTVTVTSPRLFCVNLYSHAIDFKFFNILLKHEPLKFSGCSVLQEENVFVLYIYRMQQWVKKELWTVAVLGKMCKIDGKMFIDLNGFLPAIHVLPIHLRYQKGRPMS